MSKSTERPVWPWAMRYRNRAFYEMVSCMIRHEPPAGERARDERAGKVAELLSRFA